MVLLYNNIRIRTELCAVPNLKVNSNIQSLDFSFYKQTFSCFGS